MENRDIFLEAGGKQYTYIPALNDREDHINALAELVQQNLAGWPVEEIPAEEREAGRHRALTCGAEN